MNNEKKKKTKDEKKLVRKELKGVLSEKKVQASKTGIHYESRYLRSILDPVGSGSGSKIPDTVTCPSMPFTGQLKTQLTAAATGVVGLIVGCSCPQQSFATAQNTSTPGAITWTAFGPAPWFTTVNQNCQALRVVSALLTAQVQGSSNNNQGRMIAAFYPTLGLNRTQQATLPPGTSALVENSTYAITKSVAAQGNAVECRYIPLDPASLGYTNPAASGPAGVASGYLVIIIDGLASGVIVEFQYTENLETIPANSNASIATSTPSNSDPYEIAVASNKLSASPEISVQQSAAARSGVSEIMKTSFSATTPVSEPTFMERMIGGVDKGMKFLERATPIASSLLALL